MHIATHTLPVLYTVHALLVLYTYRQINDWHGSHNPVKIFHLGKQSVYYNYHKQQKLNGRKLLRFSRIFDELQKFSLLIDKRHPLDIANYVNKSCKFSQQFHKS